MALHAPARKEMQLTEGAARLRRTEGTLTGALARVCRWKRILQPGEFATIAEVAELEAIVSDATRPRDMLVHL